MFCCTRSRGGIREKDPEEDPIEYPADGGDDDDGEEEEEEESSEDEEEEEEHLAPADSTTLPTIVPLLQRHSLLYVCCCTNFINTNHQSLLLHYHLHFENTRHNPSPPPPVPSPPLPLLVPSSPLLLPSTDCKDDIPKADLPPQKRLCLTAPTPRFEIGETSTAATARQAKRPMSREVGYGITDTWDELVDAIQKIAPTTLEGIN
ncbi:hypothetical protein Tco_1176269 [Tanacetum coccineum]